MYDPYYATSSAASSPDIDGIIGAILGLGVLFWLLIIALSILVMVAKWKVFKKANVDGWEALIPVHNDIVELKLGGVKTYWWFLNLIIICGIGPLVFSFWKSIALAKSYGKDTLFGVLLALFPFVCYPILAWGKAEYVGNGTNVNTASND